jgi:hypothetical protein
MSITAGERTPSPRSSRDNTASRIGSHSRGLGILPPLLAAGPEAGAKDQCFVSLEHRGHPTREPASTSGCPPTEAWCRDAEAIVKTGFS